MEWSDVEAWEGAIAAAVAAGGPHAFAVRRTSATLLGLDGFGVGEDGWIPEPEVGVARGRHRRPGVRTVTGLVAGDVVAIGGIRTTSAARCLVDLGTVAGPDLVERALECALRLQLVTLEALGSGVLAHRQGAAVLRAVLGRRPASAPVTESDLETRFVQLCRLGHLPEPDRQIRVRGGRYRIDAGWPWCRVGIELDGASTHGPGRLGADLRRQNCILLDDWLLLRFTWADVVHHPDRTLREVRRALAVGLTRS